MCQIFLSRYGGTSNYGRSNNIGGGGWSAPKPANQGYGRNTGYVFKTLAVNPIMASHR